MRFCPTHLHTDRSHEYSAEENVLLFVFKSVVECELEMDTLLIKEEVSHRCRIGYAETKVAWHS